MKTKHAIILLTLGSGLLINGCVSAVHQGLLNLKKDLPSESVTKIIQSNEGTHCLTIKENKINKVDISYKDNNQYSVIIGKKMNIRSYCYYLWAFKNDKLFFWGTPLEFARHNSKIVNEIGIEAVKLINE
jgi:hypothetical protein